MPTHDPFGHSFSDSLRSAHSGAHGTRRHTYPAPPLVGGAGVLVRHLPGAGQVVSLAQPPPAVESGEGVLVDPPSPSAAFADERYWFQPAVADQGSSDDDTARLNLVSNPPPKVDGADAARSPAVASNLAELPTAAGGAGSHLLRSGRKIRYFAMHDALGRKRYVFWQEPTRAVLVRVSGAAAGGGKYLGSVLPGPSADVDPSTPLAPGHLGDGAPGAEDALILNALEVGQNTHDLTTPSSQTYFVGHLLRRNADGTAVVVVNAFQTRDCS